MSDDRLRLVASVEDQFTGPLAKLKHGITDISDTTRKHTGVWRKDWEAVTTEIGRFRGALGNMGPAFGAIGIGSLAAATSLGGAVVALRNFSKESQGLSILSKQTDIAIDSLRALKSLGERVGVSGDAMLNAADTFSRAARLFKRGWHEAVQELPAMNLDWLARDLKGASSVEDMMQRMLKALPKVSNIEARRRVMVMFFGTEDIDKIIQEFGDKTAAHLAQIRENIGKLSPESEKAARDFEANVSKMEQRWERLKQATAGPLLGAANDFLDDLEKRGPFGQNKNAPSKSPPTDLDESLDAQMRGQLPLSKAEKDRDARIREVEGRLSRQTGELDYARKRIVREPEVERRLTTEIQRLTDELRRLREQGASLSPSSFEGPLGGGSLIQKAAWGGVGFGGGPLGGYRGVGGGHGGFGRESFGGTRGSPAPPGGEGVPRGGSTAAPAKRGIGEYQGPLGGGSGYPEVPVGDRGMLDLITRAEGTGRKGYNDSFAHQLQGSLTDKTLAEIEQIQRGMKGSSAIGRYQFMRNTLFGSRGRPGLLDELGIRRDEKFSPEVQDRLANALIERRYREAQRVHKREGGDFMSHFRTALAREWASFPGDYGQRGINGGMYPGQRASIGRERLTEAAQKWLRDREGGVAGGGAPPAAQRQGDAFMQRFFDRGGGAAVARGPMVEGGKGTLHLRFENAPKNLKVDHEMGGLFRAVTESRHRPSEMNEL
ncbi:MAG: hypothetical protein WAP03_22060 [Methylorubrum rhodinum]|uniref:hypothetical protein n=1 Tax=Methylorubrum rhodinum TaxID=29428 RepID=UPI003BAEEF1C